MALWKWNITTLSRWKLPNESGNFCKTIMWIFKSIPQKISAKTASRFLDPYFGIFDYKKSKKIFDCQGKNQIPDIKTVSAKNIKKRFHLHSYRHRSFIKNILHAYQPVKSGEKRGF